MQVVCIEFSLYAWCVCAYNRLHTRARTFKTVCWVQMLWITQPIKQKPVQLFATQRIYKHTHTRWGEKKQEDKCEQVSRLVYVTAIELVYKSFVLKLKCFVHSLVTVLQCLLLLLFVCLFILLLLLLLCSYSCLCSAISHSLCYSYSIYLLLSWVRSYYINTTDVANFLQHFLSSQTVSIECVLCVMMMMRKK